MASASGSPASQIDTIVILMKENHSYDNYFGMLGRGDDFTFDSNGIPLYNNPDRAGNPVRVHHVSVPFNPSFAVSQTWNASHLEFNEGQIDGFVATTDSPEPMGYLDEGDLPWYYALAKTGIGDRYFSSCLAQTFPNRRYLEAATSDGVVSTTLPSPFVHPPKTGLVWDRLDAAQVDDVPPDIHVPPDQPGGFDRYGFRVPYLVASPFSRPGHVSSIIFDHTSILATIEQRWGLASLTRRDAAASPLWDFLDLNSPPTFAEPPSLPRPAIWPFTGTR